MVSLYVNDLFRCQAPASMPKSHPSGPHMGNIVGPIWATQMGSMSIWPRAPCPPQMGSPRMSLHGLIVGPTWAAHYGLPIWAPRWQPRWARCQIGHGLHVSPKRAAHELAYMGLLWARPEQPKWVANMGPTLEAQMGSMSIWPWATCQRAIYIKLIIQTKHLERLNSW